MAEATLVPRLSAPSERTRDRLRRSLQPRPDHGPLTFGMVGKQHDPTQTCFELKAEARHRWWWR
jgi:hypothetical protein